MNTWTRYRLLVLIAGGVILLDQATKALIRQNLALYETWAPWPWLAPYARIVHWYNTGVAFGLLQERGQFFAILAVLVALVIVYYFPRIPSRETWLRLALSLQLGGALGNLIDRLTLGHVTDFISVGTFPVFNVADASITIGTALLILSVWLQERREQRAQKVSNSHPEEGFSTPANDQQ
ncbi:signal peptidase II [uncultured Thermanaerothrix sp.]|uniref:signal peptidase II n=1 Tax=uncultured Thermanaerothrix sp. TaxID=1195149 RepID=UPI002629A774|nr:signal peptidase II [uncultured Thermanaerothrix sp.]